MKQTNTLTSNNAYSNTPADLIKRVGVLAYGLLGYIVGCTGLFWLILGAGGIAPIGLSEWQAGSTASALLTDLALIVIFSVQHSIMARSWFKAWLTIYIPAAAERATYMLMSGIVTVLAIYFWQALPGTVWGIESATAQIAMWGMYALGWTYLLLSTMVTNHFELMGLRQVYLYFRNKPYTKLPFTRKFMYRYSRHPMMLGFLIGLWAVPVMSATHFILSALFTLYIGVGMYFEERDLTKNFGDTYRKYKQEIATFIPNLY